MDILLLFCCVITVLMWGSSIGQNKRLGDRSSAADLSQAMPEAADIRRAVSQASHADMVQLTMMLMAQNQSIMTLLTNMRIKDLQVARLSAGAATTDTEIRLLKTQLQQKETEIRQLNTQLQQHETYTQQLRSSIKSTYTRWGRTRCPGSGTTLVYSGYMAGSSHDQSGSGANYLCLADTPTWDHFDTAHGYGGVRGVEYEFASHRQFDLSKFFGSNIFNGDAPCVVCETNRATTIMIPGTRVCYGGWTREYIGYLVSEYPGHAHSAEFVCLDRRPEVLPGGSRNDNGARLYLSDVECGQGALCPPYIQGRELTCVVCSK